MADDSAEIGYNSDNRPKPRGRPADAGRFDKLQAELAELLQEAKPLKPSHQLKLEGVKEWATSLSPEDHAQWLDNLLDRGSERSKEPNAKQEALALKLEQEVQAELEQVAQALKLEQETRQAELEQVAQALKLEQETRQAELEQVAQALNLEQEARQAQAELEQALKLEQEARQAQAEREQVAQALAQVLRGAEHKS